MHVLRRTARDRVALDVLVHTSETCAYDAEIRRLGARIFACPGHRIPWRYARDFRRIVAGCGPYDAVHSHVHYFSGVVLALARRLRIPVRIAHSHCMEDDSNSTGPLRSLYLAATRKAICRNATHGLAASEPAAGALFGPDWRRDPKYRVLHCGIDLEPFRENGAGSARAALGLPADAFTIGHVGRFDENKNHRFLLEIAQVAMAANPKVRLLLIGDGPLRSSMEKRVCEMGMSGRVVFAGVRDDVPRILSSAVDVFVMPSISEGLPLATVEAQAAGVPCVISDSIPSEVDVVPLLVQRLSLGESPLIWAKAAVTKCRPAIVQSEALAAVERSPLNIERSAANLETLYLGAVREVASHVC